MGLSCGSCGGTVERRTARYYLVPGGREVILLCRSCQTKRDSRKQYSPSNGPTRSRIKIRESDLAPDPAEVLDREERRGP